MRTYLWAERTASMRIVEEGSHGVRVLRLAGEFDAPDVPAVARRLEALSSVGAVRLLVDLAEVGFATAALLGCLVVARSNARKRQGDLVVSAASKPVDRVLHRLGRDQLLRMSRSDEDAIRHLGTGRGAARSGAPCLL